MAIRSKAMRIFANSLMAITDFLFRGDESPSQAIIEMGQSDIEWEPRRGNATGIFWGGRRLPKHDKGHFLIVGTTRSGKTTLLRLFAQDVLPDVKRNLNTRAVINDPKQETYSILHGMDLSDATLILEPKDARSFAWAPAADICDCSAAEVFAHLLVPVQANETEAKGGDFFKKTVRNIVALVVNAFIDSGVPWEFWDVMGTLQCDSRIERVVGSSDQGRMALRRLFDGRQETLQDVLVSIDAELAGLKIIASLWHHAALEGRSISVHEFLRQGKVLIMPSPRSEGDPVIRMNQIFFQFMASQMLSLPEADTLQFPTKSYVILDELRFAKGLPGLNQLLVEGASKGTRVVVGFQNLAGLRDAFGHDKAEEIAALCTNQAFLRANTRETAKWVAEHFGTERVRVRGRSGSGNHTTYSWQLVERPVLLDSNILGLPLPSYEPPDDVVDLEGYYRTHGINGYHSKLSAVRLFDQETGMLKSKAAVPNFIPRPAQQQKLQYQDSDLDKFGFSKPSDWDVRESFES